MLIHQFVRTYVEDIWTHSTVHTSPLCVHPVLSPPPGPAVALRLRPCASLLTEMCDEYLEKIKHAFY